ncbi:MAG: hypothetical protein FWC27_13410 [Firmicutes bacterium]|nr:hypothetical protein [Bacillota bacterium]
MKTLQPTKKALGADTFSALDEMNCDDLGQLLAAMPAEVAGAQAALPLKKIRLINAAWILLCLVIFTGALLFTLHMLAK